MTIKQIDIEIEKCLRDAYTSVPKETSQSTFNQLSNAFERQDWHSALTIMKRQYKDILDVQEKLKPIQKLRNQQRSIKNDIIFRELTDKDKQIIRECLQAAVEGPFFPDWEFSSLFGLKRSEVAEMAAKWPNVNANDTGVFRAINSSFNNLLGYPHKKWDRWSDYISLSPDEVKTIFKRWRELEKSTTFQENLI